MGLPEIRNGDFGEMSEMSEMKFICDQKYDLDQYFAQYFFFIILTSIQTIDIDININSLCQCSDLLAK